MRRKIAPMHLAGVVMGKPRATKIEGNAKEIAALQEALDAYRLGNLAQAHELASTTHPSTPEHWGNSYVMGLVALARADVDKAREHFERALLLNPSAAEVRLSLGDVLRQQGLLIEAAEHFRAAISLTPENPLGHFNLGLIAESGPDSTALNEAKSHYLRAVQLNDAFPEAWNNLANVQRALGELEVAESSYRKACELRPQFAEAWDNLGVLTQIDRKDSRTAVAHYVRAIEANPEFAQAHFHLGVLAAGEGLTEQAATHYERVLQIQPNHAEAYNNLGMIFLDNNFFEEAKVCLERALAARPDLAEAHNNMGILLSRIEYFDEAEDSFQQAIALRHDFAEPHYGIGLGLNTKGQYQDAILAFQRALSSRERFADAAAGLAVAYQAVGDIKNAAIWFEQSCEYQRNDVLKINRATLLPPIMGTVEEVIASRQNLEKNLDGLLEEGLEFSELDAIKSANLNFYLAYHGLNDRPIQAKIARLYAESCPSLNYVSQNYLKQRLAAKLSNNAPNSATQKIRIGFVSRFFYHHSVGNFFNPIIEHLATLDDFEVTLISIGFSTDDTLKKTAAQCSAHIHLVANSLDVARQRIEALDLDVLAYAEVGMDVFTYLLAFSRLAPIQCALHGHSVTSGLTTLDYFVSSHLIEPTNAQSQFSEKLALLDSLPMYLSPFPIMHEQRATKAALGLPPSGKLYLCPMMLQKVHPDMDAIIQAILHKDDSATVIFFGHNRHLEWTQMLRARFERTIPDVISRIIFLPFVSEIQRFRQMLSAADVVLDTLGHGGGTTCNLCYSVGAPIVSLLGETSRSRGPSSFYKLMGITECVADSHEEYVEIALKIANDREFHESIRTKTLANLSKLYDNQHTFDCYSAFFRSVARDSSQALLVATQNSESSHVAS